MFARQPLNGSKEMYGVLTDPIDFAEVQCLGEQSLPGAAEEPVNRRKLVQTRCFVGGMGLATAGAAAFMMFQDTRCENGTHSALPFSMVHKDSARHGSLMLLTLLGVAVALCYPITVARAPRPYFLHVAGSYLVVNALTMCSNVYTVWAGCNGMDSVRIFTAQLSLVGFVASFILLQYSILLKAEALNVDANEEELKKSNLRKSFRALFNPMTMGFALLSAVVPLGFVERGETTLWYVVVFSQAAFLVLFCSLLLVFTAMAIKEMRKCHVTLAQSSLDKEQRKHMQRLLAMHAMATMVANLTTMSLFMSIAGVILNVHGESVMFGAFALDNLAQMTCALALSGIAASMSKQVDKIVLTDIDGECIHKLQPKEANDVVDNFKAAGAAAQNTVDVERAGATSPLADAPFELE
eukprot:TRINITY_DN421_c0_g1_i1.p2 TRINITY_DN421_c0_g1~~TRINITY_DN421_c0_g1_i1.p2  ORF type:complete len:410 (-),score=131.45 TRINITY_DN421_c0_g1_i1:95-1324(-)